MRRIGNVRFTQDFVGPVAAVTEFPMIPYHFGHDTGTIDKGHYNYPHIRRINLRGIVKFLLPFNGKLLGRFRQIDNFFSGILNTAQIGIGFQGIESPPLEEFFMWVNTSCNDLKAFAMQL